MQTEADEKDRLLHRLRDTGPREAPAEVPFEDEKPGVLGGLRSAMGFGKTGSEHDRRIAGVPTPQTQTSLGEQVGRWYEGVGGIEDVTDKAVTRGAMNFGGLNRDRWPAITEEGVNRQQRIYRGDARAPGDINLDNTAGYHRGNSSIKNQISGLSRLSRTGDSIHMLTDAPDNHTKEHELTHGALLGGVDGMEVGIHENVIENRGSFTQEGTPPMVGRVSPDAEVIDASGYFSDPAEIDARLAEVKRRYAHHTGVLVETPGQAEDALEWFNNTRDERIELFDDQDSHGHAWYESLSPEQKEEMYARMGELVDSGPVLGGLV